MKRGGEDIRKESGRSSSPWADKVVFIDNNDLLIAREELDILRNCRASTS